jgi:hypothetical protein
VDDDFVEEQAAALRMAAATTHSSPRERCPERKGMP